MKVITECARCIVSRATFELLEATHNPALRFRAMTEIFRLLSKEFKPTAAPAVLGTKRDRLIKWITDNDDPYKRIKQKSNRKALELLPYAREIVDSGYTQEERFKKACLCAIVGNIMEFDIPDHNFTFGSLKRLFREAEKDLAIDDTNKIFRIAIKSKNTLFLADNAGEIVFDTLLVEQLKNMGLTVIAGVKEAPIINDATMTDAKISGMDKIADKIVTTGTDAVGFAPKESSKEFMKIYKSADMIFAKGMGYAETLTEYKLSKPHALLFRTKCNCVANYFKVPKGKNVAKLMPG